jgi:phospholipase C
VRLPGMAFRYGVALGVTVPALAASVLAVVPAGAAAAPARPAGRAAGTHWGTGRTRTPIKHLVVIFQENASFDHYFGTYPYAVNPPGEPRFVARRGTPHVNGLTSALLTRNPNAANPQRLDRSQALTCGPSNNYHNEQVAADGGKMDNVVAGTGGNTTLADCLASAGDRTGDRGPQPDYAVMDYFDGNTVTALWNYAQRFAMSDASYGTGYGQSDVGAVNVTGANTYGAVCGDAGHVYAPAGVTVPACPAGTGTATPGRPQAAGSGTMTGDTDPYYDGCSNDSAGTGATIAMGGRNIGDLLDAARVSWGWFEGGFTPTGSTTGGLPVCGAQSPMLNGTLEQDYSPHHEPFQYYPQTANPLHLPPSAPAMIGSQDQANHQYDLSSFWAAADTGRLPAVSYLKAPRSDDGHPGNSDPLDEQQFLVSTINHLESLPSWRSTAVIIAYDDSGGWYDHQPSPGGYASNATVDTLTGAGACDPAGASVPVTSTGTPEQARCGLGPRLPFLVISPYARSNFVSHTVIDQSSIVRFIEDNWHLPRLGNGAADANPAAGEIDGMFSFHARPGIRPLFLDPVTGEPVTGSGPHFTRPR